jgi:predicted nucleic acid-binding protein
MTRFVLAPDAAMVLAAQRAAVPVRHRLLAPTLFRSQVLAHLYGQVRMGEFARQEAEVRLTYLRKLQIRYLGDRSLQQVAWRLTEQLGWNDTFRAEYLALTQLQAEALVTLDADLMRSAANMVVFSSVEDLLA